MSFIINPYIHGAGAPAPPAFPTIADVWEWHEPDREGLNDLDPISQLTGQVAPGAGHNWTQAVAGNKPTYLANQLNGAGVADFSSATAVDHLTALNPSALTAVHAFIVVKSDDDPPGVSKIPWVFGTSGTKDTYPHTDSVIYQGPFSSTRRTIGDPAIALTSWRVVEVVSTATKYEFRIDGATSGTGVFFTSGTNTVAVLSACWLGSNVSGANGWDGQIAGDYIFSAELSGGDRTSVIDYINTRFGLSSS